MRDILFKGKSKKNGEWVTGRGVDVNWVDAYIIVLQEDSTVGWCGVEEIEVEPSTVCQYTGLTDKNGTKIFEGDILEFSDRLVVVFWHAHLGCWDSNFLKFTNKENSRDDMSPCRWGFRAKVIGNIYDNLELLEV